MAPTAPDLKLQLDEARLVPFQTRRRSSTRSRHTDRELAELHGWVTTTDAEMHRWLSVALPALGERAVRALNPDGDFAGNWRVSWNSYAEAAGVHTYSLILREAEELTLESLLVDDLELYPYEYREEVQADGLAIQAKVVGTPEDVERIRELVRARDAFPVVRRGIQPQPREMRLGLAEWSEYEDRVKYRVVLVDAGMEDGVGGALGRIAEEKNRAAVGYYANLMERLAELLVERGVLTRQEIEGAREAAARGTGVARQEFWHVADVDAL